MSGIAIEEIEAYAIGTRLAKWAAAGATTIVVRTPFKLVTGETTQLRLNPGESNEETVTVSSVQGREVVISTGLTYAHNAGEIVARQVQTSMIGDSLITTAKIAADAITNAKIADDQIDSEHYVAGSIDEEHLANNAVTDVKLRDSAALSVIGRGANSTGDPADIAAGTDAYVLRRSGTALGFGQVATGGITDLAVTEAKIGANAVIAGKLANGAVDTTARLANEIVTAAKIGANAVIAGKLANGAVDTTARLANEIVTAAKIANRTRSFIVPVLSSLDAQTYGFYGLTLPDGTTSDGYGYFRIPSDFVSGMTVEALVYPTTTGNIWAGNYAYYGALGESYSTHSATVAPAAVALTANQQAAICSLSLSSAALGDYVRLYFTRIGSHASDTLNAAAYIIGWLVSYTADS